MTNNVKRLTNEFTNSEPYISCPIVTQLLEDAIIENYLKNTSKEKDLLLRAKYRLLHGNSEMYASKDGTIFSSTKRTISEIDEKLEKL